MDNKYKEYEEIFSEEIEEQPDDHDFVKAEMVRRGVPFQSVTRLFNQFMVASGRAFTKEQKEKRIASVLKVPTFATKKGFESKVAKILISMNGTMTQRAAAAAIRSYAKKNDLPVYHRPVKTTPVRVSFTKQFCDFLADNPFMKEEKVLAYLNDENNATYIKRNINNYLEIWRMLQVVLRKHNNGI